VRAELGATLEKFKNAKDGEAGMALCTNFLDLDVQDAHPPSRAFGNGKGRGDTMVVARQMFAAIGFYLGWYAPEFETPYGYYCAPKIDTGPEASSIVEQIIKAALKKLLQTQ
jgi:hypothetical protein